MIAGRLPAAAFVQQARFAASGVAFLRVTLSGMSPPPRRHRPGNGEDAAHVAALSGGGPSQVGIDGSMRARDVSRPTAVDEAEAERLVQVSYRPRSKPPASGSTGG
jgi:hypothetical protein